MNLKQTFLEKLYKSSEISDYVDGESNNYELALSSSYEEKQKIQKIIPGLRQRAYEHLVVELKGYSHGIIFVQTYRTKKGFLVELGFDRGEENPDIWRKAEVPLEETVHIFDLVCGLDMIPDMRGFRRKFHECNQNSVRSVLPEYPPDLYGRNHK